jgi:hypothetical protein
MYLKGKKRSGQEGDMREDSMFPNFYKHIEKDYNNGKVI